MKRVIKFAVVGASGVVVNQAILYFLTDFVGLFYLLSAVISGGCAIFSNFVLNEAWTFRDRSKGRKGIIRRGIQYNIVSVASFPINLVVLFVLVEFFNVYYLISNMAGIFCAFLWNYSVNSRWTWREA